MHHTKEELIEPNTDCFKCQHCAEGFKSINEMHGHALGIYKDNLSLNQEDEYYECELCQRYFKEPQCQVEHIEAMHRYCKRAFNEADFRIHQENIHECKKCRKYFKKKKYLKTHEESC